MFSQNAFAESWYDSCSPSHPLPALVKRVLVGPGNQPCSLEVSGKPEPTGEPA